MEKEPSPVPDEPLRESPAQADPDCAAATEQPVAHLRLERRGAPSLADPA